MDYAHAVREGVQRTNLSHDDVLWVLSSCFTSSQWLPELIFEAKVFPGHNAGNTTVDIGALSVATLSLMLAQHILLDVEVNNISKVLPLVRLGGYEHANKLLQGYLERVNVEAGGEEDEGSQNGDEDEEEVKDVYDQYPAGFAEANRKLDRLALLTREVLFESLQCPGQSRDVFAGLAFCFALRDGLKQVAFCRSETMSRADFRGRREP